MKLMEWPVFRSAIFRKAKYLVSTPQKAQSVLEILETGVVGIEPLPMQTGFIKASATEVNKAWANIHALKFQVYKNGEPTDREASIVISERSYLPLDPLGTLKQKDREKLASIKDIAKVRHAQVRAAASAQDKHRDMAGFIIQWGFILLCLYGVIALVRGC